MKDVHGIQSFVSTHSEKKSDSMLVISFQSQMLLTSAFSQQNSAISVEQSVLVFVLFTTTTRKLRVDVNAVQSDREGQSV